MKRNSFTQVLVLGKSLLNETVENRCGSVVCVCVYCAALYKVNLIWVDAAHTHTLHMQRMHKYTQGNKVSNGERERTQVK